MQGNVNFESGNPCDSFDIVLKRLYEFLSSNFEPHPNKIVELPLFSRAVNKKVGILVNKCDRYDYWAKKVDRHLALDEGTSPAFTWYHQELCLYLPDYVSSENNHTTPFYDFISYPIHWPKALACPAAALPGPLRQVFHDSVDIEMNYVEATMFQSGSYLSAVKHYALGTWNLITAPDADKANSAIERWTLEFMDLSINYSVGKLIMSLVKLLAEFLPLNGLLEKVRDITSQCYTFISNKYYQATAPQPPSADSVEATSLSGFFMENFTDIPAIASALAAGAALFASIFVVGKVSDGSKKDTWQAAADGFYAIGKFKTGFVAIASMMKEFSTIVYDIVFRYLIGEKEGTLYKFITNANVLEDGDCSKEHFFKYVDYILNPANLVDIHQNNVVKKQMNFVIQIIEDIKKKCAEDPLINMPLNTREYINKMYERLIKVEKEIKKRPVVNPIRFNPFWVNIVGSSGLGKSAFVPMLVDYLKKSLIKISERTNIDFEIPSAEQWFFPVNFADKFLTHYNGHYVVSIDDLLQDAPGTLETSSPLSLIQWVSCVPHFTNQAALEDKGTPFTSKFIVSTSNDMNMDRKEITCPEALRRRVNVNIIVRHNTDKNATIDPMFGTKPIKFELTKAGSTAVLKTFNTAQALMEYIIVKYVQWYQLQQRILSSREVNPTILDDMMGNIMSTLDKEDFIEKGVLDLNDINRLYDETVEETRSWRCFVGTSVPTVMKRNWHCYRLRLIDIEQYTCDCDDHVAVNRSYSKYCSVVSKPVGIQRFHAHRAMYQRDDMEYSKFLLTAKTVTNKIWNCFKWKNVRLVLTGMGIYAAYYITYRISSGLEKVGDGLHGLKLRRSYSGDEIVEHTKLQYNISKPGRIAPRVAAVESTTKIDEFLSTSVSKQAYDLAYKSLLGKGAICTLQFVKDGKSYANTAIRIGGRAILTNNHFMTTLTPGLKFNLKIYTNNDGIQQTEHQFDPSKLRQIGNIDACVYICDASICESHDIRKHFVKNSVMADYRDAIVLTLHPQSHIPIVMTNVVAEPNLTARIDYETNGDVYHTLDCYQTNCPVEKGMSGSILFATANKVAQRILGIQVCRNKYNHNGYFKPISQEMINETLSLLNYTMPQDAIAVEASYLDGVKPPNLGNCKMEYLGKLPKDKIVRGQTVTKIKESLVHDINDRTQEPSVLHDHDDRMKEELIGKSVIFRAMEGFDHPIGSIDRRTLHQCVDELSVEYDVMLDLKEIPRRLLTDVEMINGVPGVINRVEMKSSPGYPYVLERKDTTRGGKYEWFDELEPTPEYGKLYSMKPKLASGLKQAEQQLLEGKQIPVMAYACLKDETRPLDKITNGKTRAFICLPLIYNLLVRKYFGAFIAALHAKAGKVSSCVGIDPAKQWKDIYYKLMEKNCLWEDFDYANWDQHLHPELVYRVANIVNYWYKDTADSPVGRLRYLLLDTLIHTHIIIKDRVFRKSSGQCSGCAITAELNCLVHDILMYYVWKKIAAINSFETDLKHYRDSVASIMYGDDIVISVVPEYQGLFNGNTIKPIMVDLGMNITPGDKVSTTFTTKDPSQILFLKRAFRVDGNFVKAPLRSDIVKNIYQWVHSSDDDADATINNCYTALRESYMHGYSYFDDTLKEINDKIKKYNRLGRAQLSAITMSYDDLDQKYRDEVFTCAGFETVAHVAG